MPKRLFKKARKRFRHKRKRYATEWVEDLPDVPSPDTIYVVGGRSHPYRIVMQCPKRKCDHLVYLDVFEDADPKWRFHEHRDGSLSLSPSIFLPKLPCRSHYQVKKGKIVWTPRPWYRRFFQRSPW